MLWGIIFCNLYFFLNGYLFYKINWLIIWVNCDEKIFLDIYIKFIKSVYFNYIVGYVLIF